MLFLLLKSLHITSVVLFLGNVITGAFWKAHGDARGELRAREQALAGIIASDRWFTVPAVVLILITGVTMAELQGYPLHATKWIAWSLILFGLSGAAFVLFVGPLQKKLLANTRAGLAGTWNQAEYDSLSRRWKIWGTVATLPPLAVLVLMVFKPA